MKLHKTRCPICRHKHPDIRTIPDPEGFAFRSMDCLPFHRNIQQDSIIENLFNVLKTSIRRLLEICPGHEEAHGWMEAYGGNEHVERQQCVF